jgi:glycosyltransferase 2 family protein
MRRLKLACLIGGLSLTAWLIAHIGGPAVAAALRAAGWTGLLAIAGFHLIASTLMGLACWRLQQVGKRRLFVWGRLLRDAGSEVLPLSQIGGYLLYARALVIHGIAATGAAASIVVDATIEFCAEIVYITIGVCLLAALLPDSDFVAPAVAGLALAVLAVISFAAFQRRGLEPLTRFTARLSRAWLGGIVGFEGAMAVQSEIRRIHELKHRLWAPFLFHLTAWMLGGVESWLALRFMGASLSLTPVIAIECLVYAARAAGFLVPNALGVQETAYVVVGAAFGLTPDAALGLSLLKRGRDLLLGIPTLLVWQLFESRKQWRLAGGRALRHLDEAAD